MSKFVIGFFPKLQDIEEALNNLEEADYDTKKSYLVKTDEKTEKNSSILGIKFANSLNDLGIKQSSNLQLDKKNLCYCISVEDRTESSAEEILKDSSAQKTIII